MSVNWPSRISTLFPGRRSSALQAGCGDAFLRKVRRHLHADILGSLAGYLELLRILIFARHVAVGYPEDAGVERDIGRAGGEWIDENRGRRTGRDRRSRALLRNLCTCASERRDR